MDHIVVDHVDFAYQKEFVLKQVCLSIPKGTFVGVIGPNGGGKTTLLKLLLGFLKPLEGSIHIAGQPISQMQKNMGYVPQSHDLDMDFPITVFELVLMGCMSDIPLFSGFSEDSKKKAKKAMELMGLKEYQNQAFGHLSGGLVQRTLIARAIASNPEFLFLDEPISNVDLKTKDELLKTIKSFKQDKTILMVTHDLKALMDMVDLVLYVEKEIKTLKPQEVCGHFSLGLYHDPLEKNHEHS